MPEVPVWVTIAAAVLLAATVALIRFATRSWVSKTLEHVEGSTTHERVHLGEYAVFRRNEEGRIVHRTATSGEHMFPSVTISRSLLRTGYRFKYTVLDPTKPSIFGKAHFSSGFLILTCHQKNKPYLGVFKCDSEHAENWKIGVFSGVSSAGAWPHAGPTVLSRKNTNVTLAEAEQFVPMGGVEIIPDDERAFVAFWRSRCSAASGA